MISPISSDCAGNDRPLPGADPAIHDASSVRPARHEAMKRFDTASDIAWRELIRDLIAMANSGGGRLVVEMTADEIGNGSDVPKSEPSITSEAILQRLAQWADSAFEAVDVHGIERAGFEAVEIVVGPARFPIGMAPPADSAAASCFYFRHGDRTVPGTAADLHAFYVRLLKRPTTPLVARDSQGDRATDRVSRRGFEQARHNSAVEGRRSQPATRADCHRSCCAGTTSPGRQRIVPLATEGFGPRAELPARSPRGEQLRYPSRATPART